MGETDSGTGASSWGSLAEEAPLANAASSCAASRVPWSMARFASSSPARSAPPDSLLARVALHALVFGNARAVATLWRRFVREIRFAHWDSCRYMGEWTAALQKASGDPTLQTYVRPHPEPLKLWLISGPKL